jgi:hypothetical protein
MALSRCGVANRVLRASNQKEAALAPVFARRRPG